MKMDHARNKAAARALALAAVICLALPAFAEVDGEEFYTAVSSGNTARVADLLTAGADIDYARPNGWRPVNQACMNGDLAMTKFLVKKGAGLSYTNKGGWFPLLGAVNSGNADLVAYLLERP